MRFDYARKERLLRSARNYGVGVAVDNECGVVVAARDGMDMGVRVAVIVGVGVGGKFVHPL
jgi:hypothetical protein